MAKPKSKQLSYISLPHIPYCTTTTTSPAAASSLHALLLLSASPPPAKKSPFPIPTSPRLLQLCLLFFLFLLSVLGLLMLTLGLPSFLPSPCPLPDPPAPSQENYGLVDNGGGGGGRGRREESGEFWRQPEGMGYRPCLNFSGEYQRASVAVAKERSKYLMVVVSGGLSQQRNQIVDAVVIARILGAALVVPILQVNVIWGDHR